MSRRAVAVPLRASTVNRYSPGGSLVKRKLPWSSRMVANMKCLAMRSGIRSGIFWLCLTVSNHCLNSSLMWISPTRWLPFGGYCFLASIAPL